MNIGWGRMLIGIGVIVALLVLGALEVLTARLPAGVSLAEQARSDNSGAGPWQDFLDLGVQFPAPDHGVATVTERSESEGAIAVAQGPWR
jgi:hypothetical protein